jgi:hypothetical protein
MRADGRRLGDDFVELHLPVAVTVGPDLHLALVVQPFLGLLSLGSGEAISMHVRQPPGVSRTQRGHRLGRERFGIEEEHDRDAPAAVDVEDEEWNRLYDEPDPLHKVHGGRVEILFRSGERLVDQILFPDAHPLGARPFARPDYVAKLERLGEGIISPEECARFIDLVRRLPRLSPRELAGLNLEVLPGALRCLERDTVGIF